MIILAIIADHLSSSPLQILQHIIIPSFANSFEKGEGERLIGGPPAPDLDHPECFLLERGGFQS